MYVAGRGQSFLHREVRPWIREGARRALVYVRTRGKDGYEHRIGLEQGRGGRLVRVDGKELRRRSVLAKAFPLQLITPNSHELIEKGPGHRRRFLDWGLFHVEHDFHEVSLAYRRALQQRNVALRSGDPSYPAWDAQLAAHGERLNRFRAARLPTLEGLVGAELRALGQAYDLSLRLRSGWAEASGPDLEEVLRTRRGEDRQRGYTTAGPHRATLDVLVDGTPAERRLSRGQQKLLVYALFLGLAAFVIGEGGEPPVLLIDDLPAELDERHRSLLLQRHADRGLQCWISAVDLEVDTASARNKVFHVEHGRVAGP